MTRDWSRLHPSEMTWWELTQALFASLIALVFTLGVAVGVILIIGQIIEVQTQRISDHDRCLRNATNGLEIRECR